MIYTVPDLILRKITNPVTNINGFTPTLIKNMFEIMDADNAVGLAANQIGISKSILVWGYNDDRGCIINPKVVETSQNSSVFVEGCLSIPNVTIAVERPQGVLVEGLDIDGNNITIARDTFTARILQHEIDHLNGILMIDRADPSLVPEKLLQFRKVI